MALTFKHECQGCGAELRPDGDAFICAYECTFCADSPGRLAHLPELRRELVASRMASSAGEPPGAAALVTALLAPREGSVAG